MKNVAISNEAHQRLRQVKDLTGQKHTGGTVSYLIDFWYANHKNNDIDRLSIRRTRKRFSLNPSLLHR